MSKETYLGINVSNSSYAELQEKILADINNNRKSLIVAINPEKVLEAQRDKNLSKLLNQAQYQIPDGIGIILASKLKKGNIRERITGIDMLTTLCKMAAENKKSVFLYGAKPGVAEKAKVNLVNIYPTLKVVGTMNGYEKDQSVIKQTINSVNPDILFVALGSPNQEYWIVENMSELNVNVFQGVGGSFDVLSGNVKRAPTFFRKIGCEWLYRLAKEPVRIKRQFKLPMFLFKILLEDKSHN